MKKTLIAILTLSMLLSPLTGCGAGSPAGQRSEESGAETQSGETEQIGEAEAEPVEEAETEEPDTEKDIPAWSEPNGTAEPRALTDSAAKPRIIITQDGEVDDNNSLIRTLLYANDLDIAGIVQTSSQYHYSGDGTHEPYRWMGTDWMFDTLDAYEACYPNLIAHDPNYPTADKLRAVTVVGNVKLEGEMEEVTEGSELIRACILDDDPRTLNIAVGGGANVVARALKSIEEKYRDTEQWEEIYQKVCGKVILAA